MKESELSANQKRALVALLTCPSVAAAAEAVGLSERTLYNYLANDVFKTELRKRQDQAIAATTAALVGLSGEAVKVLRDILADPDATNAVKCRVALGWLREKREAVELQDLAARVSALEEQILRG